ncbi:MAG: phosphonate C-P lyase system protein PhnL [Gammaproteobacteria bacterium]|nr:phosphonate C-P lyase system protein PhnL [Rhodocyclaceae bacterium]MBU3908810.1 phosphonate C-P lyase system protein PhnL [Gammaproteobacteria bacterium]MBU3988419.1 phosphonate C-P lyase system protein PhnL [Gammaproteobacteria bacterium]MBU4003645.1 phosphonate C-P lyase system protein PhnL [Gammaproteobacteria bacterium]MBU4021759.1 phosphonate C-P lyase system protein PhnL [Gammaproteobacteria bacterium]
METLIDVRGLTKAFVLHNRNEARIPVLDDVNLSVAAGECVALAGPSGAGKSTLLRCLYGNYLASAGAVCIRHEGAWVDLARAAPREILAVRLRSLGYVSQFLRVIPRVSTLDVVAEPLRELGIEAAAARTRAANLLARLHLPEYLWHLPPATFSGGEQQRVNIARGLIAKKPVLLLDEPTASLDVANAGRVADLIDEARRNGTAIVGIFHDTVIRDRLATRLHAVSTQPQEIPA